MATATPPAMRPLALITGASTGIGYELASLAAEHGYELLIADEPEINQAADRSVDVPFANAGRGLGRGFLDQDFNEWRHVVETNITGTLRLIQQVGLRMRARGAGRILITGSIAGLMPEPIRLSTTAPRQFWIPLRSLCAMNCRTPA